MKKLALFVEGLTEQLFALRLLQELAGQHALAFSILKGAGGRRFDRRWEQVRLSKPEGAEFFVLLYNCAGDSRVLSDLCEQYRSLMQAGYERVLGLTDLYPEPLSSLERKQRLIDRHLQAMNVTAKMVIAVMEIEAWFLAEERHFSRLSPLLSPEVVSNVLGDVPEKILIEKIEHPSEELHHVYQRACLAYLKRTQQKTSDKILRTVNAIDYENLLCCVTTRVSALDDFCRELEAFLTKITGPPPPG